MFRKLLDFFRGSGHRHKDAGLNREWLQREVDETNRRLNAHAFVREYLNSNAPPLPLSSRPFYETVAEANKVQRRVWAVGSEAAFRAMLQGSPARKDPEKGLDPQKVSRGTYAPLPYALLRAANWYPAGFVPPINLNPQSTGAPPCSVSTRAQRTSAATTQAKRRRKTANKSGR